MADKRREKEWCGLLNGYLDGELSEKQRRKVEKSLSSDAGLRAELSALESAAGQLRGLDRERAPEGMAAAVLSRVERELILEGPEGQDESAGRRHLFLRRLTAVAAVVLLTLGVGAFVYSVLVVGPDVERGPADGEMVADAGVEEAVSGPEALEGERVARGEGAAVLEAATGEVEGLRYGSVELAVRAEALGRAQLQMEALLDEYEIGLVVRSPLEGDEEGVLYAFMCKPAQLEGMVKTLASDGGRVDLLIDAPDGGVTAVSGVSVEEVLAWAQAVETEDRTYLAQRLVRAGLREDVESLPGWVDEMLDENEGGLPGVRLLGPSEFESPELQDGAGSVAANQGSEAGAGLVVEEETPGEAAAAVVEGVQEKEEGPALVAVQIRVVRAAAGVSESPGGLDGPEVGELNVDEVGDAGGQDEAAGDVGPTGK